MNLVCAYDTETTGLPDWKNPSDSHHQPHLSAIADARACLDIYFAMKGLTSADTDAQD